MFGIENLWLFVVSGIMLNVLPGSDSLYILGRSTAQGFRAGSIAAFGVGSGTLVHILAAAFGLSAILATSAIAFTLVKAIGCLYLLYMGLSMIFCKSNNASTNAKKINTDSLNKVFMQGFLTNVLNPKVALFFLAFVPQFISADSTSKAAAFIVLGLIFNINGMIWCHILAWTSSSLSMKIKQSERITTWATRLTGGLFTYFAVKLAFSEQG